MPSATAEKLSCAPPADCCVAALPFSNVSRAALVALSAKFLLSFIGSSRDVSTRTGSPPMSRAACAKEMMLWTSAWDLRVTLVRANPPDGTHDENERSHERRGYTRLHVIRWIRHLQVRLPGRHQAQSR